MPRGGGSAGGSKRGGGINFSKPAEPSFLKRFKEKVGYKDRVTTIDDKRPLAAQDDEAERDDRDDEKPVVVVLREGDLTASEVDEETSEKAKEGDGEVPLGTKILFKKPTKRQSDDKEQEGKKTRKKDHKKQEKKLLSFDDQEDDD